MWRGKELLLCMATTLRFRWWCYSWCTIWGSSLCDWLITSDNSGSYGLNPSGTVGDVRASDPHLLLQPGADQHLPAHPEQAGGREWAQHSHQVCLLMVKMLQLRMRIGPGGDNNVISLKRPSFYCLIHFYKRKQFRAMSWGQGLPTSNLKNVISIGICLSFDRSDFGFL